MTSDSGRRLATTVAERTCRHVTARSLPAKKQQWRTGKCHMYNLKEKHLRDTSKHNDDDCMF